MFNQEPPIKEIRDRVEKLLRDHFAQSLRSGFQVEISNRLKACAARANPKKIKISREYHNIHGWGEELQNTLIHEVIHIAGILNHGPEFYREMRRIGAERYCKNNFAPREGTVYRCNECEFTVSSQSYLNECPKCGDLVSVIGKIES